MVSAASAFLAPARISFETWMRVWDTVGYDTPLWNATPDPQLTAADCYGISARSGHDPAVWLAIAGREHEWGRHPDSVLRRNDTRSWTNARSVRMPGLGYDIIVDPKRKSQYVRYRNAQQSLLDGLYRITDPTYRYVQENRVTLAEVFGIWTEDPGEYVAYVVEKISQWIAEEQQVENAQIPGFLWVPADDRHFAPGRGGQKIRGGAQHYTAGSSSLGWLTKDSGRDDPKKRVSATCLVKHEPTFEVCGWQLVKLEDTAWTTAFANPYTASIEYEHTGQGTIPDMAYEVLGKSWADIEAYVVAHDLGDFSEGIKGHKEWVNNPGLICPDGIDITRVNNAWRHYRGTPTPPPVPGWPSVPVTERDPWRADNPYAKDKWIPRMWVQMIREEGFMHSGYVISEAFPEDDKIVQYFERKRWELHEDGSTTAGLVGREALFARYPERVS